MLFPRHDWGAKENIRFIIDNIIEAISALSIERGKDIWLIGGDELISMLLAPDLVDEIQIAYIPVILGRAIPLFLEQPKKSKWELTEGQPYNSGVLVIKYEEIRFTVTRSISLFEKISILIFKSLLIQKTCLFLQSNHSVFL